MADFASEAPAGHQPVMLREAVAGLEVASGGTYIDATFGAGGHSRAILQQLGAQGRLIAVDADPAAAAAAAALADRRLSFHRANFRELDKVVAVELRGGVHGVLFDLGVSSLQLADAARGFAFARSGPLDMRLDPGGGTALRDKLAAASEAELGRVLREYGEERRWKKLARVILQRLRDGRLRHTADLAAACASGPGWRRVHPATRAFQALRIWVNDELASLADGLAAAARLLRSGGRLVAISFHSLEDRIVKRFMRQGPAGPVAQLGRLQRPDAAERELNRRARSARLRVAVKA